MKAITKRLKVLRTERSLSQIETAQRAGLKEYRYWRIESGYSDPTDVEMVAIAKVLRVAPEELADLVSVRRPVPEGKAS
jgi:transcriptional regulator with XRE-family HTH domain